MIESLGSSQAMVEAEREELCQGRTNYN
jgi:hypothetical protein